MSKTAPSFLPIGQSGNMAFGLANRPLSKTGLGVPYPNHAYRLEISFSSEIAVGILIPENSEWEVVTIANNHR